MLLPRPVRAHAAAGSFTLDANTVLVTADVGPDSVGSPTGAHWHLAGLRDAVAFLQGALRPATGYLLPIAPDGTAPDGTAPDGTVPDGTVLDGTAPTGLSSTIELALDTADGPDERLAPETYRLTVRESSVRIVGGDAAGVLFGCQTLLQLLPPEIFRRALVVGVDWVIPAVDIDDRPRFGWRGVMLDVARHFLPKHDVFRFIDLMAMHKLNVLHFHLTEDQGWRIEIKKFPRLTEVGSWRRESQLGCGDDRPGDGRPHGGYYTQDDIREIVAYAAARAITVVPEIEMPGHVQAVLAAYPEYGVTGRPIEVGTRWGIIEDVANSEQRTIDFFCDVLDEVIDLFPSRYIHVGGDECPRAQWAADPRTQQLMRERGISREADVQTWFMQQIGAHLAKRGRIMVGWDELLEGDLPDGTVISSWRGMTGAITAARRGYDVVSCPFDVVYLDYRQSDGPDEPIPVAIPLTVDDVYAFEPIPAELTADEAKHILGGQANIWTEYMDSPRTVDFFAYPRLSAISEVLWSASKDSLDGLHRRLDHHLRRLDAVGVEYRHASGPKPWQMRPGIPGRPTTRQAWQEFTDELVADIKD